MSANLIHNHHLQQGGEVFTDTSKKGDFIGFKYNGIHSSELGIVRTSDGSRFNENLLPSMQDKTVQVPGADGTYYFGSYFTQRQFNIPFAFDGLTEAQVARLKRHFGDKGIHDLVFDETPYKIYSAKVTGTATIKHIVFSEGPTNRAYKGEGNIQFTCYNPFARSDKKFLDEYSDQDYPNKREWADASRLLDNSEYGNGKVLDTWNSSNFLVVNPGDIESDWILTIELDEAVIPDMTIVLENVGKLELSETVVEEGSTLIKISSKTNLIEGFKKEEGKEIKTGELFNHAIKSGMFFKIPVSEYNNNAQPIARTFEILGPSFEVSPKIEYNYYYY